jgi:hypothetical protein
MKNGKVKDMLDYTIENTGYLNTQVVEGFLEINLDIGEKEPISLTIDVAEITCGSSYDVRMVIDFRNESEETIKKVLALIPSEQMDDCSTDYEIKDADIISEFFYQYGNNNDNF